MRVALHDDDPAALPMSGPSVRHSAIHGVTLEVGSIATAGASRLEAINSRGIACDRR